MEVRLRKEINISTWTSVISYLITGAMLDSRFQPLICRSLRSTYLGCSFNFCLLHLTAIFGGSFVTIFCILVAGLKPAPWMFSQYMLRELSKCFHPDLLKSPGTYSSVTLKLELRFQIVQSAFHTIAQETYILDVQGLTNFAARHMHLLR